MAYIKISISLFHQSSSLRSFGGISVPDVSMDEVSDLRVSHCQAKVRSFLCVYLPACMSIDVCLSACLSVCMSVCSSDCMCVCLPV